MRTGLVLAAGEGRRLGRAKALVRVGGRRLVDIAVATARDGGCAPVVVVTGAVAVDLPDVRTVHNPDWRTGMGSSLRVGLDALPADADAVVILLVDQPDIGPPVVRRLIAARADGAEIAVATYHGARRNPVLIGRAHWPAVRSTATGDAGARDFLRAHPDLITPVECADVADPTDIDTTADLARFT